MSVNSNHTIVTFRYVSVLRRCLFLHFDNCFFSNTGRLLEGEGCFVWYSWMEFPLSLWGGANFLNALTVFFNCLAKGFLMLLQKILGTFYLSLWGGRLIKSHLPWSLLPLLLINSPWWYRCVLSNTDKHIGTRFCSLVSNNGQYHNYLLIRFT